MHNMYKKESTFRTVAADQLFAGCSIALARTKKSPQLFTLSSSLKTFFVVVSILAIKFTDPGCRPACDLLFVYVEVHHRQKVPRNNSTSVVDAMKF